MAYVTAPAYFDRIESDSSIQDQKLEAASADIDDALRAGGYAVPVDLAAVAAESAAGTSIAAKIEQVCEALAAYYLTAGSGGTGTKIQKDYEEATAWLKRVRSGETQLAPLAELPKLSRQRFATVSLDGQSTPDPAPFPNDLFATARTGSWRL